jgi:ribosome-associated toxin RatA of RatAB toxin-antitoxin module
MVDFHITKQIEASQDSIWNIISDVDREQQFWHGTESIKNIRKNGKVIEREVVIAFRNSICKQVITLNPKNSVEKKRSHQLEQTVLELMCNGISA